MCSDLSSASQKRLKSIGRDLLAEPIGYITSGLAFDCLRFGLFSRCSPIGGLLGLVVVLQPRRSWMVLLLLFDVAGVATPTAARHVRNCGSF